MKRNYGLDFVKFICAFMIVCIHAPFPGLMGSIVVPLCRIAVPLFFMITGYYYSHIKETKREVKQITKILRLFVSANILYFIFSMLIKCINGKSVSAFISGVFNIKTLVKWSVFNESPFEAHLWYLGAILYVLLIIFVFEKKWNRKCLYPVVPLLLIVDLVFGKYSVLLLGRTFSYIMVRNFMFVGLPYFLIGDMLYNYNIKIKVKNNLFLIFLFICTTLIERYLLGRFGLNAIRDHYISTTFLCVSVFMLAVRFENKANKKWYDSLCFVGSKLSTGIYILHPMFINIMSEYAFGKVYDYSYPFLIFGLSILASWLLHVVSYRFKLQLHNN